MTDHEGPQGVQAPARVRVTFDDNGHLRGLLGQNSDNLRLIESRLGITTQVRGNQVTLSGDERQVELAEAVIRQLYGLVQRGLPLFPSDVERAVREICANSDVQLADILLDTVLVSSRNRVVTPKSANQKRYIDAIRANDIVFGVGPGGTGKTYLAMAMAVAALTKREVKRVVLARPAVEAGERLGFLPGDLVEKVNPYLRPLYDALYDMLEYEAVQKLLERGTLEIAPLAFMRGRTLNDAFVILDEAQNTSVAQMKMFLTRLGYASKAVITGDVTQIDLAEGMASGLVHALTILAEIPGIGVCRFSEIDVVRHPLVQRVITAYESDSRNGGGGGRA